MRASLDSGWDHSAIRLREILGPVTGAAIVREFYSRIQRDENEGVRELLDPAVVWFGTAGGVDAHRVIRGPDAFVEYLDEIQEMWEQFRVEVERVIESDETVVALTREIGRGRGGVELENETAVVFKLRRGRITEVRGYLDRAEALEEAGLEDRASG
jgi:ketosteroid isomerase-like protein